MGFTCPDFNIHILKKFNCNEAQASNYLLDGVFNQREKNMLKKFEQ